jgi:histidine triad (HIT) family protein
MEEGRMSCIFCDIVAGKIQANVVHEDDRCLAFRDVAPKAPTHILVVPKQHLRDLDVCEKTHESLLGHLLLTAKELAAKHGLAKGYRVVLNRGEHGGQSVDHLHVHVMGGRAMAWPPG